MNLRYTDDARAALFVAGLKKHGYTVSFGLSAEPQSRNDVLVTWNRIGAANRVADQFKAAGGQVLIAENATWGNDFAGECWYQIARNYHNTAGCFYNEGPHRFDSLNMPLSPWRDDTGETVILLQRGIGSAPTKMPCNFSVKMTKKYPRARIRKHPGQGKPHPIDQDLATASRVVTWGSGAAIKALSMGIKTESEMPNWIGEQDNTDAGRLSMFQNLAWAQWRHSEIENGFAFSYLLLEGSH